MMMLLYFRGMPIIGSPTVGRYGTDTISMMGVVWNQIIFKYQIGFVFIFLLHERRIQFYNNNTVLLVVHNLH